MKRIALFCSLLLFLGGNITAQEVQLPYPHTSSLSYEKNKFYLDNEQISRRDCQSFLLRNASQDTYTQFRSGLQMYQAGWTLMGIGLAADAAAIGLTTAVYIDYLMHPYDSGTGMVIALLTSAMIMGTALIAEIPAIPLICVGNKRMKNSIDTYHISLPEPQTAKNYWTVQSNNNGIGLAYHF